MIKHVNKFVRQNSELIRYGIVGGLNTLFSLVFFWLLESVFRVQYLIANAVTWVVSVILVFFANKQIVFQDKSKDDTAVKILLFFATRAVAGVLDMALLYILVDACHFIPFPSKCAVMLVVIVFNYITAKLIVFKKNNGEEKTVVITLLMKLFSVKPER